jgi:hypothetical protein
MICTDEQVISIATRAGQLAGLAPNAARAFALMAISQQLLDDAEAKLVQAQYADTAAYRRADEAEAEQMRQRSAEYLDAAQALDR